MTKTIYDTIYKVLFLFGIIKPKDEKTKSHMKYVDFNRKLVNLRRSIFLSAMLILVIFIIWLMPTVIPGFDRYVSLVLAGSIVSLTVYIISAWILYKRLLNEGMKSRKLNADYHVLIILFWCIYYAMLIVATRFFSGNLIESVTIWLSLMFVGLNTNIFDKVEGIFIFPISFVNIGAYIVIMGVDVFTAFTCMPLIAFFFCLVQINHIERLGNYYETSKTLEESTTNKRRLGNIFDKVYDIALEINITAGVCELIKVNPIYGLTEEDNSISMTSLFEHATGKAHPDDKHIFTKNLNYDYLNNELMMGRNQIYFEGRVMTSSNEYSWISVLLLRDSILEEEQYILCLVQNIEERKNREVKLRLEAEKDPLTKLYNKTTTKSLIEECLEKNSSSQHALIIIDIDNFKTINDTRGHTIGDQILLAFSAELNKNFRETDILGRAGGDEFIVLIKNINSIAMVCDKLQRFTSSFKKYGIEHGFPGRLSCSIGVSIYNKDGKTYDELFKKADAAMYEAKRNGKDQYKFSITRS